MEANVTESIQDSKLYFENLAQKALKIEDSLELKSYNDLIYDTRVILSEKLNGGCLTTALEIIRLFQRLNKSKTKKDYVITNISGLATLRNVEPRTIYNHIRKLIKVGFISNYKRLLGRVLIEINVSYLYVNQKNIPPMVLEHQEPINNNSNCKNPREHLNEVFKEPREHGYSCQNVEENQKKVEIPQEWYVSLDKFWLQFKSLFYTEQKFTDFEEKEIKFHIQESVYQGFNKPLHWIDYFEKKNSKRMELLQKYLKKDAEKQRLIIHPIYYFDSNNTKNGFTKTELWYNKQTLLEQKLNDTNKDKLKPYVRYQRVKDYINKLQPWQIENDLEQYRKKYLKTNVLLGSSKKFKTN